jgi:uncharacterized membrane protein YgcG
MRPLILKSLISTSVVIASLIASALPASAEYYPPENWEITNFHSSIFINEDSSLRITETIQADFTNERHHGIIRSIPYKYPARFGTFKTIKINLEKAVDGSNKEWDTSVSKKDGYYEIQMATEDWNYLTGPATFHLTYEVERAMNFFTEEDDNGAPEFFTHDELYWNATGTEWVVPIKQASAEIHLPHPIEKKDINTLCYTGEFGSTNQDCRAYASDSKTIQVTTRIPLETSEGLTAIIALPEGTITPPTITKQILWFLADNWPLLMPLLVFLAMFLLWMAKGRDPEVGNDTVIPHYKPPRGLRPTECGIIIDELIHPRDITATIIDLAVRGFIKIEEIKKKGILKQKTDHKLTLIKDYKNASLIEFEKKILRALFSEPKKIENLSKLFSILKKADKKQERKSVLISELKNSFYMHLPLIKKSVIEKLVKDGYFPSSPAKTRSQYMGFGFATLMITFYIGEIIFAEFGALMVGALVVSAFIVTAFGYFMPRKTHKGRETYYVLKGLYEYINTAEKDRLEFQEKANIFFEKLLPYAAAFGLTKKWTKAFDKLITQPPHWYHPASRAHFSYLHFSNSLNSMNNRITSNIVSRPGGKGGGAWSGGSGFSSGGGFSGGGFGGGGGRGI